MADEERQEEQTTQETEPEQSRAEESQPEHQPELKPEPKAEPPLQKEPEEDRGNNKEPERNQKAEKTPEPVKTPEPDKPQEPGKSKEPEKKPQHHQPQQKPATASAHTQQHHASRTVSGDKSESSEGRSRQREFFKEELRRLEGGLKRESSKIVPPSRQKYTPFIFNTLEPYYNTYTPRFLIEMPEEQFQSYSSRSTAIGLCDPWIDLRMDHELLPQISARPFTRHNTAGHSKRGSHKEKKGDGPNRKEGSTRLPKFPVVNLETKELATKQLSYSDVPMLRKELKTKYSSQSKQKVDQDYKRTQQDFYRMDLDRLDHVAPNNRRHLTSTYMAYLQNTPGSRRAVTECVQRLEEKAN